MNQFTILQVGSSISDSGGIAKSVLHNANGLRERGHTIHITACPDTWLWRQAQAQDFVTVPLQVRKKHDWAAVDPYVRLLRSTPYDIIHTHSTADYIVPALAARKIRHPGMVMTRYMALSWTGLKPWLYGKALYARLIAVSDAVRRALVSGSIAPEKVVTVHGAVETHSEPVTPAPVREELNLPADTVLIGMVARLVIEKGHRSLLEAMRLAEPGAVCLIVGTGPEEAALRERVRAWGLEERVRFLGWRMDSDAVIAALDIVVQPSLWEAACSLSIMEAMSLGKPLVVTNVGGNPELVAHNRSGLLVPRSDPSALAEALNLLVRDADLRRRMGAESCKRQQDCFSIATMAAAVENVYCDLLTSPRSLADGLGAKN